MNRRRCPLCPQPLANGAAHVETPELARPERHERVYYCLASDRHVTVSASWATDLASSLDHVRRVVRNLRRWS